MVRTRVLFVHTVASANLQQGQGQGRAVPSGTSAWGSSPNRGTLRLHGSLPQPSRLQGGKTTLIRPQERQPARRRRRSRTLLFWFSICRSIFEKVAYTVMPSRSGCRTMLRPPLCEHTDRTNCKCRTEWEAAYWIASSIAPAAIFLSSVPVSVSPPQVRSYSKVPFPLLSKI